MTKSLEETEVLVIPFRKMRIFSKVEVKTVYKSAYNRRFYMPGLCEMNLDQAIDTDCMAALQIMWDKIVCDMDKDGIVLQRVEDLHKRGSMILDGYKYLERATSGK